ncbi:MULTISPECIES: hypothetical protein [unclassified Kitasatospora]|uniref:hypothetical protein n=1 Tax=unclassified Kitasatospora TaxID=2633591 RepID=UPI00340B4E9E
MTLSRLANRVAVTTASLALAAIPLTAATPAFADSHSVSVSVGPVSLPQVPVTACVDSSCVTTPPLTSASLTATATVTHGPLPMVLLLPTVCPNGGTGLALQVTSLVPVTVTVSGSISGTTTSGTPVSVPLGPVTQTLTPGTPGLVVSACTD